MVFKKPTLERIGLEDIGTAFGCSTLSIIPPIIVGIILGEYFNIENIFAQVAFGVVVIAVLILLIKCMFVIIENNSAMKKYREAKEKEEKEYREAKEKEKKEELRRARAAKKAALQRRRQELSALEHEIVNNSLTALENFQHLPHYISATGKCAESATVRYKDGAFSPFWSDIEQAYANLADYRSAVVDIGKAADKHSKLVMKMLNAGGDSRPYAHFPVEFDQEKLRKPLLEASEDLEKMVYEAQKHPVFAQIWEQRRTTSAVIAGFANLEIAVRDMSEALSDAIDYLAQEFVSSSSIVEQMFLLETKHSAGLLEANHQQTMALKEISDKVSQVNAEVYYQNWGHYSWKI